MAERRGGWNKLTPEQHQARGTVPRRPPAPVLIPLAAPVSDPVPRHVLAGLDGPGRAFVEEAWATYGGWGVSSLALLREAGLVLDQLETRRGQPGERASQRLLVQLLRVLRLDL
jgi:hypothetical protein